MNRVIFFTVFLVLVGQYSFAKKINYEKILFPNGIPEKTNIYGIKGRAGFKLYAEEAILGHRDIVVILYSMKETTGMSDDLFKAYLSIIKKENGKLEILTTENITNYMKTFTEMPGNFYKMDGVIDAFKISDGKNGLHVNIWSIISGSGAISSSSDLFFIVNYDFSIRSILLLEKTNSFSKIRRDQYESKNNFLYYGDVDGDKITEIFVLETNYNVNSAKSINSFELSPLLTVYSYDGVEYKKSKSINVFDEGITKYKRFSVSEQINYSHIPKGLKDFFNSSEED